MKKNFLFELINLPSLQKKLNKGIKAYATDLPAIGVPTTLWLLLFDNYCLKIHSQMNDVGDWNEIGTLVFQMEDSKKPIDFKEIPGRMENDHFIRKN